MSVFSLEKLLSAERTGPRGERFNTGDDDKDEVFQKDAERILSSPAFRRLQGKTQVYPLPENDFVRNRLTHTYEVAHIGETIAKRIGKRVGLNPLQSESIAQLAFNGCLLHDIGNPPFGHTGVSSIREFFKAEGQTHPIVVNALRNGNYRNDLTRFDGNAQGFRIAATLSSWKRRGGMRLSAATLTAMVKYPFNSSADYAEKKEKYGFLDAEQAHALAAFSACGLADSDGAIYRNPISLIVEAADDVAYLTSDIQDAYRSRDIPFSEAESMLSALSTEKERSSFSQLDSSDRDYEDDVIAYYRSAAVTRMVKAASEVLSAGVFSARTMLPSDYRLDMWNNEFVSSEYRHIGPGEARIRSTCDMLVYRGRRKIAVQVAGGKLIKFVLGMQIAALSEILFKLHEILVDYPSIPTSISSRMTVKFELEEVIQHCISEVGKYVSRESAQIFWGMPREAQDVMGEILNDMIDQKLSTDDPTVAYRVIQISLDFVAGTTDRYLSDYSRQWGGPYVQ